jgi:hypothetical protein
MNRLPVEAPEAKEEQDPGKKQPTMSGDRPGKPEESQPKSCRPKREASDPFSTRKPLRASGFRAFGAPAFLRQLYDGCGPAALPPLIKGTSIGSGYFLLRGHLPALPDRPTCQPAVFAVVSELPIKAADALTTPNRAEQARREQ